MRTRAGADGGGRPRTSEQEDEGRTGPLALRARVGGEADDDVLLD